MTTSSIINYTQYLSHSLPIIEPKVVFNILFDCDEFIQSNCKDPIWTTTRDITFKCSTIRKSIEIGITLILTEIDIPSTSKCLYRNLCSMSQFIFYRDWVTSNTVHSILNECDEFVSDDATEPNWSLSRRPDSINETGRDPLASLLVTILIEECNPLTIQCLYHKIQQKEKYKNFYGFSETEIGIVVKNSTSFVSDKDKWLPSNEAIQTIAAFEREYEALKIQKSLLKTSQTKDLERMRVKLAEYNAEYNTNCEIYQYDKKHSGRCL
uniref:Uncharacterized protein n=1 Tax=viral metagenome TaxID=1070528 RepID=A0A6C0J509_9ZZZZ